jgi:hypothetical protein
MFYVHSPEVLGFDIAPQKQGDVLSIVHCLATSLSCPRLSIIRANDNRGALASENHGISQNMTKYCTLFPQELAPVPPMCRFRPMIRLRVFMGDKFLTPRVSRTRPFAASAFAPGNNNYLGLRRQVRLQQRADSLAQLRIR